MSRARFFHVAVVLCLACSSACAGFESGPDEGDIPSGVVVAAAQTALPACKSNARGTVYFVLDTRAFFYCDGNDHQPLDLEGLDGQDGVSAIVRVRAASASEAGDAGCGTRGVVIEAGADADRDGQLDGPPASAAVVCDGATGPQGEPGRDGSDGAEGAPGEAGPQGEGGLNSLVRTESEPAGDNCEHGGLAVLVGADLDRDGTLSDDEVTQTSYVCHGEDGTSPSPFDLDGDGFRVADGDCDDTDPNVNPGAIEILENGIDDDCDLDTPDAHSGGPGDDDDSDGWSEEQGDCNDTDAEINPGALELLGDAINNDCDSATTDDTAPATCSDAELLADKNALQMAAAIELCQQTTADAAPAQRKWGLISAELLNADGSAPSSAALATMQTLQSAVMTAYGAIEPRAGATLLGLSNGTMRGTDDPDFRTPVQGTTFSRLGSSPPDYYGGVLPTSWHPCDAPCGGSGANDSVNLRLTIRVPTNVDGFRLSSRFFTSDHSVSTCTNYNDHALGLLTGSATEGSGDRNILIDTNANVLEANGAMFEHCRTSSGGCSMCFEGDGELAGTGMENYFATSWGTAEIPVLPGETITLDLMIFDVGDAIQDSHLLLDGFEWMVD